MHTPVAIITRTRNRPSLLGRALDSVLGQTYEDWQLVVVNDGGDPAQVEAVAREREGDFRGRLRILHDTRSRGMQAAANVGLEASSSDYVVIHDDDDSWEPEFLEACVAVLDDPLHPSVAGVISWSRLVTEQMDEEGNVTEQESQPFNTWVNRVSLHRMAQMNMFPPISFLFRRSVLAEIGYYREDLLPLGDWEFNLRFLGRYEIQVLPRLLANYHHRVNVRSGSASNSVIGESHLHDFYDARLRNELLRADIERGVSGLGYLVGVGKGLWDLEQRLERTDREVRRLARRVGRKGAFRRALRGLEKRLLGR